MVLEAFDKFLADSAVLDDDGRLNAEGRAGFDAICGLIRSGNVAEAEEHLVSLIMKVEMRGAVGEQRKTMAALMGPPTPKSSTSHWQESPVPRR